MKRSQLRQLIQQVIKQNKLIKQNDNINYRGEMKINNAAFQAIAKILSDPYQYTELRYAAQDIADYTQEQCQEYDIVYSDVMINAIYEVAKLIRRSKLSIFD